MLQIKELCVKYDNIQVLHGISLELQEGELVALIGANGAGKTTTLSTISGVKRAFSGQIVYDGKDITKAGTDEIVKMGIVQVPEGRQIFSKMTIEENLILGAYTEKDSQRQKQNMQRVMELFPILRERRRQTAGTLSGGEQQMLAIARALMGNPRMLLLDEPSMGLSPLMTEQVFDAVKSLNDQGTTILLVEQNAYDAMEISHRTYIMENGVITREGKSSELMRDPAIKQAYLGGD
ncbi:MAG TPA: ABC transporter ATP-binding protein [Candidatus Merdiplasma excrementigallinarum]|uniref:ABC transporter ATP-binding protein n=1 Tax=Candidatus Merdiplasma excrementigallinarum TaxID=2840864 RepID=A0A9D1NZ75_9FIRM|nr:ABC transporter ATP-binding protein [Candidatus Merdiplasma excrementigallinarum]